MIAVIKHEKSLLNLATKLFRNSSCNACWPNDSVTTPLWLMSINNPKIWIMLELIQKNIEILSRKIVSNLRVLGFFFNVRNMICVFLGHTPKNASKVAHCQSILMSVWAVSIVHFLAFHQILAVSKIVLTFLLHRFIYHLAIL